MILTIGSPGTGLTFLNWSIIYLRGDNFYTSLDNDTYEVVNDPITSIGTAHMQQKDHIKSIAQLSKLTRATNKSVVYYVPRSQSDFDHILSFSGKKIIFNPGTCSDKLMARMFCVLHHGNESDPYIKLVDFLATKYNKQIVKQILIESNRFFTEYYTIDPTYQDCSVIDYNDVFENLDQTICKLFDYLELEIVPERFESWMQVYQKYRSVNRDFLPLFLGECVEVDSKIKIKILKEIIQWKSNQLKADTIPLM